MGNYAEHEAQSYQVSKALQAYFKAIGSPVQIFYGPERLDRQDYPAPIVLFRRDSEGSDRLDPPSGFRRNPRLLNTKMQAVTLEIFARSSSAGARRQDHEALADFIADRVVCGLDVVSNAMRLTVSYSGGRYLRRSERADVDTWSGVVYQLRLMLGRGIAHLNWSGQALPEAVISQISTALGTVS